MDLKKDLSSIADAVMKVMEAELSPKQKQIAKMAEPKHKIDAGDLAKLRAGHKPVKEETEEQLDELSKKTLSNYINKAHDSGSEAAFKQGKLHGQGHAAWNTKPAPKGSPYSSGGPTKQAKQYGDAISTDWKRTIGIRKATEKLSKEEVEQIDELSKDTLKSYSNKVVDKTRTMPQGEKKQKHLAGFGKAQEKMKKEEVDLQEKSDDYEVKQSKTDPDIHHVHYKGKKIGYVYGNKKDMWGHEYHAMGTGDDGYSSKREAVNALKADHKHHISGAYMKEETELEEASYSAKAARAGKDIGKPGKAFAKIASGAAKRYGSEEKGKKVAGAILKKLRMKEDEEIDMSDEDIEQLLEAFEYDQENQMSFSEMIAAYKEVGLKALVSEEPDNEQFTKELKDQEASMMGKKKQPSVAAASTQGVKQMPEEVNADEINGVAIETIDERTLTEPETKKKEEVVKSMKKNLTGFKSRYGERGKSVLYATATKIAKEKA